MLKQMIKGIVIGGALLAMVSPAQADQEINIFGASAQYKYWTEGAPQFMESAAVGCAVGDIWSARSEKVNKQDGRDMGITICHHDLAIKDASGAAVPAGLGGSVYADDIIIRYADFASVEGLIAVLETGSEKPDDCGANNLTHRLMADAGASFFTNGTGKADDGGVQGSACYDITLGTSDIDPQCFTQSTYGPEKYGATDMDTLAQWNAAMGTQPFPPYLPCKTCEPQDPDKWWVREFTFGDAGWDDYTGFTPERPVIVPFAFFRSDANNDPDLGATDPPVNNLSRGMAQMLFSGQVKNWNLYDPTHNQAVTLCIRHAGSGTHATLDWAVVRPSILVKEAVHPDETGVGTTKVVTYTNKGSSEEIACAAVSGAIGYADADKKGTISNPCADGVCRIQYQGHWATRDNIKNGLYDFWAANIVYYKNTDTSDLLTDMLAYMSDPTNLDATAKADFWASQNEMKVNRANCKSGIKKK